MAVGLALRILRPSNARVEPPSWRVLRVLVFPLESA